MVEAEEKNSEKKQPTIAKEGRRQKRGFFAASFEVVQCAAVEVEELSRGGRKKGEKVCVEKVFFPPKRNLPRKEKNSEFLSKKEKFPGGML